MPTDRTDLTTRAPDPRPFGEREAVAPTATATPAGEAVGASTPAGNTVTDVLRSAEEMLSPVGAIACAAGMLAAMARGPEHAHDHDAPPLPGKERLAEVASYLSGLAARMEANES